MQFPTFYGIREIKDLIVKKYNQDLLDIRNWWNDHDVGNRTFTSLSANGLNMNSNKITNVANGTNPQDAAAFGQITSGPTFTDWASYSPTIQGLNISSKTFFWMQMGNHIFVKGVLTNSTAVASNFSITLPNSTVINSSKSAQDWYLGHGERILTAAGGQHDASMMLDIFYDGSNTNLVFLTIQNGSNHFTKMTGSAIFANGDSCALHFDYPI